jgi:hypothetical protein
MTPMILSPRRKAATFEAAALAAFCSPFSHLFEL